VREQKKEEKVVEEEANLSKEENGWNKEMTAEELLEGSYDKDDVIPGYDEEWYSTQWSSGRKMLMTSTRKTLIILQE
jgi:hypothetical protein